MLVADSSKHVRQAEAAQTLHGQPASENAMHQAASKRASTNIQIMQSSTCIPSFIGDGSAASAPLSSTARTAQAAPSQLQVHRRSPLMRDADILCVTYTNQSETKPSKNTIARHVNWHSKSQRESLRGSKLARLLESSY